MPGVRRERLAEVMAGIFATLGKKLALLRQCPFCGGTGQVPGMKIGSKVPCPVCRGTGAIPNV